MSQYDSKTWIQAEGEARLISVIVPTFNRADLISETLDCLHQQTHRPLEILVVDDGSTDATQEVVQTWARACDQNKGFQVRYIRQDNQGGGVARNLGTRESRGEYIQYLDSDDLLAPNKLSAQINTLSTTEEAAVVYGDWRFFESVGNTWSVYAPWDEKQESDDLHAWLTGWFCPPLALLWKRSDIARTGPWDESLAADQDGEYAMRFFLRGGCLIHCPDAWGYYRRYVDAACSVAGKNKRGSFDSRYRVIQRVEEELEKQGRLECYCDALSLRYAELAKRSALTYGDMAEQCLKKSRALSTNGKVPAIFRHYWLSNLIGISTKQKIAHRIRTMLRIPIKDPLFHNNEPVARLNSVGDLTTYDL